MYWNLSVDAYEIHFFVFEDRVVPFQATRDVPAHFRQALQKQALFGPRGDTLLKPT